MNNRILQGSALLVATALSMTACSSTPTDSPSSSTSASASQSATAEARVMHDALGDVTVPFEAQRIATTAPAFTTAVLLL